MSQSDYIKYKRVSNQLRNEKQPPVLNSQTLIDFEQYALENTIINTVPALNRLVPTGSQRVFQMDKVVGNCPIFPVCQNTNLRTNRLPMSSVYFTPTPQPNNIKIVNNSATMRTGCDCTSNICKCKVGAFGIVR
jgi:hypothetical protein